MLKLQPDALKSLPLSRLQSARADVGDTWLLVQAINNAAGGDAVLPPERLKRLFEAFWPELLAKLNSIDVTEKVPERNREETQSEILMALLSIERQMLAFAPRSGGLGMLDLDEFAGRVASSLNPGGGPLPGGLHHFSPTGALGTRIGSLTGFDPSGSAQPTGAQGAQGTRGP